jgi:hypothetical protein
MHVIRQDHPRVDAKRAFHPRLPHCLAQYIDMPHEQVRSSVGQRGGEEDQGTGPAGAKVARHPATLAKDG